MNVEDNTTLVRVFRETVQRVPCTSSSLFSLASFVVISPTRNLVLVYHGRGCSAEDSEVANEIAKEYKSEEKRIKAAAGKPDPTPDAEKNEVLSMTEGASNNAGDIVAVFLDVFWMTPEDYKFRNKFVSPVQKNLQKAFHVIERSDARSSKFRLRKLGTSVPDKHGCVALLPFPIYHPKKIALLVVGDQYDLWFGESVNRETQAIARQLVVNLMDSTVPFGDGVTRRYKGLFPGVFYDSPLRIQMQGYEDPAFRCHFQHDVEFLRQRDSNPYVYIRDKNANELLCETSCVDVFSWIGWGRGGSAGEKGAGAGTGGMHAQRAEPADRSKGAHKDDGNDHDGSFFRDIYTPKKHQHPYGEMERTSSVNSNLTPY